MHNKLAMNSKEINYTEAFEELKVIVAALEQGEITVDELSGKVERAVQLIKTCKSKLDRADEDVRRILGELNEGSTAEAADK
ncbi:MAG: exodeoxyribonuclease VII small subunit [Tannerella sp.]|nr:exodeoxyribonuclease VII small subunit [Tannerella sp.]